MTFAGIGAVVRTAVVVARLLPWGRIVPTLAARWFGAVSLRFEEGVSKPLYAGSSQNRQLAYHLTQLWIANRTRGDVEDARATVVWRRKAGRSGDSRTVHGLWYPKVASGLLTPAARPSEVARLPSNAETVHLGLMVRSPSNRAYMVCTATYNDFGAWQNYQHPDYEISSGVYEVDVMIEGTRGLTGYLKFDVQWPGGTSDPLILER